MLSPFVFSVVGPTVFYLAYSCLFTDRIFILGLGGERGSGGEEERKGKWCSDKFRSVGFSFFFFNRPSFFLPFVVFYGIVAWWGALTGLSLFCFFSWTIFLRVSVCVLFPSTEKTANRRV